MGGIGTLPGPPDSILHASFSADGRHVLAHAATTVQGFSVVRSGYVWIWPADLEGLTALADARAGRALTVDELQLYFDDAPEASEPPERQ